MRIAWGSNMRQKLHKPLKYRSSDDGRAATMDTCCESCMVTAVCELLLLVSDERDVDVLLHLDHRLFVLRRSDARGAHWLYEYVAHRC